jgi:hypothetical protein
MSTVDQAKSRASPCHRFVMYDYYSLLLGEAPKYGVTVATARLAAEFTPWC